MKNFSGIVLDYTTGTPVSNTLVKIIRFEYGDIFGAGFNPGFIRDMNTSLVRNIRVDSVLTDANGKYSVELDISRPPYNSYMIGVMKDGYIHVDTLPRILSKNRDTLQDTTFIDKNSYLRLVINNAGLSASDTMSIRTFYQGIHGETPYFRFAAFDSLNYFYRDSVLYTGPVTNAVLTDTISFKAFPMARVRWTTWTNGVPTERDTIVNLTEFNITEVNINY